MQQAALFLLFFATSLVAFDTTFSSSDRFLTRHVCPGGVNYQSAQRDPQLDAILVEFATVSTDEFAAYSEKTRLAALINLYNLATIKLITSNLAQKSIKNIPSAWSRKWINFGGSKVSLDQIEHEIIRKQFDEPRIHFALVCAAKSCPALKIGAYTPGDLDRQLTEAAKIFLTDTSKNSVGKKTLRLSAIFQWYGDDFKKKYGGYQNYVEQVLGLNGKYSVKFMHYDWQLNSAPCP